MPVYGSLYVCVSACLCVCEIVRLCDCVSVCLCQFSCVYVCISMSFCLSVLVRAGGRVPFPIPVLMGVLTCGHVHLHVFVLKPVCVPTSVSVCVRGGECVRATMGDFVCACVRDCAYVYGCVYTCLIACMHVSVHVPVSLCVRACACATTIKRKRRMFLLLYPYFTYSVFISGVSNELDSYVHELGYACTCLSIPSICAHTAIIIIYSMMQETQQKKLPNMMLRQQAIVDLLTSIMLFFFSLVNIDKLFQPARSQTKFTAVSTRNLIHYLVGRISMWSVNMRNPGKVRNVVNTQFTKR